MEAMVSKAGRKLYGSIGLIGILASWEILPRAGIVPELYLPPLTKVLYETWKEWQQGYLFMNISLSMYRVLAGFLLAAFFGIGIGLILGYYLPGLAEPVFPLLRFFGQINPYSLLPLFVVFLGIGESSKIIMVAWTAVFPILFHTITGAQTVEPELLKAAKAMGAARREILIKVILPAAGPSVFDGLRIGIEMAFFILIAAEMAGGTGGLGAMIHLSGMNFLIPRLFAAGLCTVLLSVGMNQFVYYIRKRVFFWKESTRFFQKEERPGFSKPLRAKQLLIIIVFSVVILVSGFLESRHAYKLMNDPDTSGEFGNFISE